MTDAWALLDAALDDAAAEGRTVEVWLRDDDATTTTPALDRLTQLARRFSLPVLLAVIPKPAEPALAGFTAAEPLLVPTQHGFAHKNHAGLLQRACELGLQRPRDMVRDDLARGAAKMASLFAGRQSDVLVPPWNRIAPELVSDLPALGFNGLSTFGALHADSPGLDVLNSSLDIIDWRHGRVCHQEHKLAGRLAAQVRDGGPIGILTHHLVHDAAAWHFLDRAFERLTAHAHVRLAAAEQLRRLQPST